MPDFGSCGFTNCFVRGVPASKGGRRKLGLGKLAVDVNVRIGFSAPVLESGIRAWHL